MQLIEAGGWHSDYERRYIKLNAPDDYKALMEIFTNGHSFDDPADDPAPAPAAPEYYTEDSAGDWQQYALFA